MFTGIIEEKGTITAMKQNSETIEMHIKAKRVLSDVQLGDSIAVNGVCLTVTSFTNDSFSVDVMPETFRSTSLRLLSTGSHVNLERAMAANERFGGHFVSGHVDGVGKIRSKQKVDNAVYYEIEVSSDLRKYMIYKGSVAVDGTSVTIFAVTDQSFTISLIPYTLHETILGDKDVGDIVNIECDLLGKYVENFVSKQGHEEKKKPLTRDFLVDNGFL